MSDIDFKEFGQVNPDDLIPVVNEQELRKHLVEHEPFNPASIRKWISDKLKVDSQEGCRVRAIYIDGVPAGWCGIQPDDTGYELAVVISRKFWGNGITIFKTLLGWAKELGHNEVVFHLLDSRPEYKVLNKMATKVYKTELLGRCFTSYCIVV